MNGIFISKGESLIRLSKPYTDRAEQEAIADVLASGYLSQGKNVSKFESMLAEYVGTKYAFATSSCTTALHLSLVVLGIGPGDEVIVPDFTFPATANVVIQQQAVPILVDIDLDTFTINIEDFSAKITPKTKAVIPVHLFGLSADMSPVLRLAKKHGFAVVEDAACALGAHYKGKKCGALGDMACFSFHPRKSITTGEGGMITTDDDQLAGEIELLRAHGASRTDGRFTFQKAGFNYRLSEIQGAIGIRQMDKLDWILERRRKLADYLSKQLGPFKNLTRPIEPRYARHTFQSYVVLLDQNLNRDKIIKDMAQQGIETTIGTYALHSQPFFSQKYHYQESDIPYSQRAYEGSLTLPLYPTMSENEMAKIIDALYEVINANYKG